MSKRYLVIFVTFLIISLIAINLKTCSRLKDARKLQHAMQDSNRMYRNENGKLISERLAFVAAAKDMKGLIEFHKLRGDTFETKFNKATTSLTLLKKSIKVTGAATPRIIKKDTSIFIGGLRIDTPSFEVDTGDAYHHMRILGNKGKVGYSFSVTDNTELHSEDLGKKGTRVSVLNKNPYVESSEAISLIVAPKKRQFWLRLKDGAIGAGIMLIFKSL